MGDCNTSGDLLKIQKDLLNFEPLSRETFFNGEKCKVLNLGRKRQMHRYKIEQMVSSLEAELIGSIWSPG